MDMEVEIQSIIDLHLSTIKIKQDELSLLQYVEMF